MKRLMWPVMLLALAVSFVVGTVDRPSDTSATARVNALASQIRCPTCQGLSVGESDSPLARSSRDEIVRQVDEGRTDQQIRDYFVSRYGNDALMKTTSKGIGAVLWTLPGALGLLAVVGAAFALRRWRQTKSAVDLTDADRELVATAMRSRS